MDDWAKRGLRAAFVTGGMLMLGAGIASANECCPDRPTSPLAPPMGVTACEGKNGGLAPDACVAAGQALDAVPVDALSDAVVPVAPLSGTVAGTVDFAIGARGQVEVVRSGGATSEVVAGAAAMAGTRPAGAVVAAWASRAGIEDVVSVDDDGAALAGRHRKEVGLFGRSWPQPAPVAAGPVLTASGAVPGLGATVGGTLGSAVAGGRRSGSVAGAVVGALAGAGVGAGVGVGGRLTIPFVGASAQAGGHVGASAPAGVHVRASAEAGVQDGGPAKVGVEPSADGELAEAPAVGAELVGPVAPGAVVSGGSMSAELRPGRPNVDGPVSGPPGSTGAVLAGAAVVGAVAAAAVAASAVSAGAESAGALTARALTAGAVAAAAMSADSPSSGGPLTDGPVLDAPVPGDAPAGPMSGDAAEGALDGRGLPQVGAVPSEPEMPDLGPLAELADRLRGAVMGTEYQELLLV